MWYFQVYRKEREYYDRKCLYVCERGGEREYLEVKVEERAGGWWLVGSSWFEGDESVQVEDNSFGQRASGGICEITPHFNGLSDNNIIVHGLSLCTVLLYYVLTTFSPMSPLILIIFSCLHFTHSSCSLYSEYGVWNLECGMWKKIWRLVCCCCCSFSHSFCILYFRRFPANLPHSIKSESKQQWRVEKKEAKKKWWWSQRWCDEMRWDEMGCEMGWWERGRGNRHGHITRHTRR